MGSKSWISGRTLQQRSNLYILSLASASYEKFQANISFPPSPFPTFPAKSEANADVSVCHFSLRFLPYGEKCLLGSWASVPGLITHSKGHTTAATVCLCHYNKDTQEHIPSHNTRGKMAMLRLPHQSPTPDGCHKPWLLSCLITTLGTMHTLLHNPSSVTLCSGARCAV